MNKSTKGGRPPTYANCKQRRTVEDSKRRRRFRREMAHLRKLIRASARRWAEFDRRWRIGYGPSWFHGAERTPAL